MSSTDIDPTEITKFDPGLTEKVMGWLRPFLKAYHRSEVRGLELGRGRRRQQPHRRLLQEDRLHPGQPRERR